MDVGSIVGTVRPVAIGQSARRDEAADFAAAFDAATATTAGAGDPADDTIAAAQRAIAAFDLTLPPTGPSAAATYAEGARQVSVVQGLPGGSYDFTRITPRQMTIVGGAMIARGTVRAAGIAGALDLAGQDPASSAAVNFFAYLRQQAAENETIPGGTNTAVQQRTSIAVLKRVQMEGGAPITYDNNYPTTPHTLTVEEANAKLKAAIVAFGKEAALTPAQRIRRDVLKDKKLTEEALRAMPQAEHDAAEKEIGEEVARRLKKLGLADADGRPTPATDGADTAAWEDAGTRAAADGANCPREWLRMAVSP